MARYRVDARGPEPAAEFPMEGCQRMLVGLVRRIRDPGQCLVCSEQFVRRQACQFAGYALAIGLGRQVVDVRQPGGPVGWSPGARRAYGRGPVIVALTVGGSTASGGSERRRPLT